ncbi:HD domain-containing protein [Saccharothrix saharensis]|uniref:HD domain-containing protein n=1 Tax=Saccharothrix saharensis TaxID=571190 RepID=UPI0036801B5F
MTPLPELPDLPFPRTEVALNTVRYVRDISAPAIFNHAVRAYFFGRFLGEEKGLRPDEDYDDELLFLGCVLHDVGLTEAGDGEQTFDLDGADLAARHLTAQGVSAERVEVVWDAVALHLTGAIALRKRPEIALMAAGTGYDIRPHGPALPAGYADRVHAALPRLGGAAALHDAIVRQALAKPHKAPVFTLPGELLRQRTGQAWPTWRELVDAEPSWGDYAPPAG